MAGASEYAYGVGLEKLGKASGIRAGEFSHIRGADSFRLSF